MHRTKSWAKTPSFWSYKKGALCAWTLSSRDCSRRKEEQVKLRFSDEKESSRRFSFKIERKNVDYCTLVVKIRERSQITIHNIVNRSKLRLLFNQVYTQNRHNVISSFSLWSWKVNHQLLILCKVKIDVHPFCHWSSCSSQKSIYIGVVNVTTMQQLVSLYNRILLSFWDLGCLSSKSSVRHTNMFCQRIESSFETYNKIKWLFSCIGVSTIVVRWHF